MDLLKFGKYKKIKEPLPLVAITQSSSQATTMATETISRWTDRETSRDVYVRVANSTLMNNIEEKNNLNQNEDDNNLFFRQLRAAIKYAATMQFNDVTSSSTKSLVNSQYTSPVTASTKYLQYRRKYKNFQRVVSSGHSSTTTKIPHYYSYYKDAMVVQEISPMPDYLNGYPVQAKGRTSEMPKGRSTLLDHEGYYEDREDLIGQQVTEY